MLNGVSAKCYDIFQNLIEFQKIVLLRRIVLLLPMADRPRDRLSRKLNPDSSMYMRCGSSATTNSA